MSDSSRRDDIEGRPRAPLSRSDGRRPWRGTSALNRLRIAPETRERPDDPKHRKEG